MSMLLQRSSDALKVAIPYPMRRSILRWRFASRQPTARLRVLPDFLIIGAMRAGTSSLYKYLGAHPSILPSLRKEICFFSRFFSSQDETWYRAHFPMRPTIQLIERLRGQPIQTFEATPDYLYDPRAPQRTAALLPDVKIIVLLRDPVARAFSHYQHAVRLGFEQLSFEEAIAQEPQRIGPEKRRIATDPTYYSRSLLRFSYFDRGLYAEQLERWFEFYSPEQFLILASEEFFAQTAQVYTKILRFLELSNWQLPTLPNYSYLGARKSRGNPASEMTASVRRELASRYAPHNQRLITLLNRDFGWSEASVRSSPHR